MSNVRSQQRREDVDFRVLRFLEEHPDHSQRDMSRALGLSIGGVNYCLQALVAKGLVKMENFRTSRNKLGYLYVLTPQGIAERMSLTNRFLHRKLAEHEALKAEIEATQRYASNNFPSKGSND